MEFLKLALAKLVDQPGNSNSTAAIFVAPAGTWKTLATTDTSIRPPADLLAEAADSGSIQRGDKWIVLPLNSSHLANGQLAIGNPDIADTIELPQVVAGLLASIDIVASREQLRRRVERLQAFLEIAGKWHQNIEMESLLTEMAEAATSLLSAERATIFLWDRRSKMLIGRPALGVESGELRIPESTGIVGQAIKSGQPQRANKQSDANLIDQSVDDQLQFTTRTLLCVPLISGRGKTLGAFELINKIEGEFTTEDERELLELANHASSAIENCRNIRKLMARKDDSDSDGPRLIGDCGPIKKIHQSIAKIGPTDLPVLILGENGTGKDIAGRLIHASSERRTKPFVAINCAAMTETLVESEMFGHVKGAFTDAHADKPGKFETAAGGTLFLDEIGELSPSSQAKLLRAIEEKVIVRVGGSETIETDTRILAATNRDLTAMVRERTFREDLFFRLNVVTLQMPPLRERGDDISLLAGHFLEEFCLAAHRAVPEFTPAARKLLLAHPWPGNVRELRNLMERLA
ncbi:MAG: sigma 54-interacting transcriptional regulator, partial [Planctomycetota bacterium]